MTRSHDGLARRWPSSGAGRRSVCCSVAMLLVLVATQSGCSSDADDAGRPGREQSSTSRPATTTTATTAPTAMTSTTIDALPEDGTFPDFAGVGVDKAITLLSAAGFGQVQAVDGTGQNRLVDATDAWVVAAQSVPPGLAIDKSTPITLFVVSDGETASSPADLGFVEVPEVLYLPVGDALDDLVALGLTTVVLNDFSGAGRAVPPDETWVITSQLPVAGSWSTLAQQVSLGALPKDEIPKPKD